MLTEQELSMLIREWVLAHRSCGNTPSVDETADLIASGTLDSMGFIELLAYIESLTDQKINLHEFDSDAFTSIKGLVHNLFQTKTPA